MPYTIISATKNSRASKRMYAQANRQIEKWSKFVFIGIANVSPFILILPKFGVSLFAYFTATVPANDMLVLPTPTW